MFHREPEILLSLVYETALAGKAFYGAFIIDSGKPRSPHCQILTRDNEIHLIVLHSKESSA